MGWDPIEDIKDAGRSIESSVRNEIKRVPSNVKEYDKTITYGATGQLSGIPGAGELGGATGNMVDQYEQDYADAQARYEAMLQAEEQRQQRIRDAVTKIGQVFGAYDDDYYGGIKKDYLNYATPQLDDQYNQARRQLILSLKGGPGTASSYGAKSMADLKRRYYTQRAGLQENALSFADQVRSNISKAKQGLTDQARTGSGIDKIGEMAAREAQNAATPPSYDPIADVFSAFTGTVANDAAARAGGYRGAEIPLVFSSGGGSSGGSVKEVK